MKSSLEIKVLQMFIDLESQNWYQNVGMLKQSQRKTAYVIVN